LLLLVGLGNPGSDYARHRHNVGFMAVDAVAERHGFAPERRKFRGLLREGALSGEKCLILKPQTYMNDSGESVGEATRFHKLDPRDVVVMHDELDLVPGKLRVKAGGGTAGHNGLRSIDAHIGPDFRRVRIGVGHPGRKEAVLRWVLNDFAKADREWLEILLDAIAEAAPLLAKADDAAFATKVALLQQRAEVKETSSGPRKPRDGA
jgi:PTH1 family peptidyl-tRNA hydrolase